MAVDPDNEESQKHFVHHKPRLSNTLVHSIHSLIIQTQKPTWQITGLPWQRGSINMSWTKMNSNVNVWISLQTSLSKEMTDDFFFCLAATVG